MCLLTFITSLLILPGLVRNEEQVYNDYSTSLQHNSKNLSMNNSSEQAVKFDLNQYSLCSISCQNNTCECCLSGEYAIPLSVCAFASINFKEETLTFGFSANEWPLYSKGFRMDWIESYCALYTTFRHHQIKFCWEGQIQKDENSFSMCPRILVMGDGNKFFEVIFNCWRFSEDAVLRSDSYFSFDSILMRKPLKLIKFLSESE